MTPSSTSPVAAPAGAASPTAYHGVVAAMLTPCRAPGTVDPQGTTRLARVLVEQGCHGLFVLGSTGELPLLDEDDRAALLVAAREGAGPNARLYAGVSGTGVCQTIRYARLAAEAGADVAMIMAPFFLKFDQVELEAYVRAIADASPIPVGIYHHLRMPSVFEPATVARLAGHPNLVTMKDTSADLDRMRKLIRGTAGQGLALFQGSEPLILPSLEAGAHGCVSALANVAPRWHRELLDAWSRGDREAAKQAQQRITHLAGLFRLEPVGRSFAHFAYVLRYAAQAQGWIESICGMTPGFKPDPAFTHAVREHLKAVGLI